jgi:hypothetical protein
MGLLKSPCSLRGPRGGVRGGLFLATLACGGSLEPANGSTVDGGSGHSDGGGSTSTSSSGSGDDADAASGAPVLDGAASPPAPDAAELCSSKVSQISRASNGDCEGANAFGTCNGEMLEADCGCSSTAGGCVCRRNGKLVNMVAYDCAACEGVGASWAACGFPPML